MEQLQSAKLGPVCYFVHLFLVDLLDFEAGELGQVRAKHLLEDVVFVHLVLSLAPDVYLGKGLPYLESELLHLPLDVLGLLDQLGVALRQSLLLLVVGRLQLLNLSDKVFLQLFEGSLELFFQGQDVLLAIPNAFVHYLKIVAYDFFEKHVILRDIFVGILQRDDFMGFVLGLSETATHAEHLPLCQAVEGQYIIVLYASKLVIAALKEVEQTDAPADLIDLGPQLLLLTLQLFSEVVCLCCIEVHHVAFLGGGVGLGWVAAFGRRVRGWCLRLFLLFDEYFGGEVLGVVELLANASTAFGLLHSLQIINKQPSKPPQADQYYTYMNQYIQSLHQLLSCYINNNNQRMIEVNQSDIDFYRRKIQNLEEENLYLHEDVAKLRAKLRVAQDYEIKYTLLMGSHQKEVEKAKAMAQKQQQARVQQLLGVKLAESDQRWKLQFTQFEQQLLQQTQQQVESLEKELSDKSKQLGELKERSEDIEFITFRINKLDKQNQSLKEEIEEMKVFYEEQRTHEMKQVRAVLGNNYRERLEEQKQKYMERVIELEKRLNALQMHDDNQTYVVSDITNKELTSFKSLLESKQEQYAKEVGELTHLLNFKNAEIKKYLEEHSHIYEEQRQQINSKNQYIGLIEEKMLQKEKEHQIELLNLIERLNSLKEEQNYELNKQVESLREALSKMQELQHQRETSHQQEIYELGKKMQEEKRRFNEDKNYHKRKISQLSLRIKEAEEDKENCESQAISSSLREIDGKEDQTTNYENGIIFLERQLKKCQFKLQEKTKTVSKLYKDMNSLRQERDKEFDDLKEKMKQDKRNYEGRILNLEQQMQNLSDKVKHHQKEDLRKQKEMQKQRAEYQEQIKSLKEYMEEVTRDYNRVIEDRKGVEASYREERERSFASKSDLNHIKQQKWLQLQKQKNQLHIIYKQKEEQLKIHYEQLTDDINNQLNKVKQECEVLRKENQLIRDENSKLIQRLEISHQSNKMAQYNKKMASLNLQIALTQDLYENLIKAKSRLNYPLDQADQSVSEPLQISFSQ